MENTYSKYLNNSRLSYQPIRVTQPNIPLVYVKTSLPGWG